MALLRFAPGGRKSWPWIGRPSEAVKITGWARPARSPGTSAGTVPGASSRARPPATSIRGRAGWRAPEAR